MSVSSLGLSASRSYCFLSVGTHFLKDVHRELFAPSTTHQTVPEMKFILASPECNSRTHFYRKMSGSSCCQVWGQAGRRQGRELGGGGWSRGGGRGCGRGGAWAGRLREHRPRRSTRPTRKGPSARSSGHREGLRGTDCQGDGHWSSTQGPHRVRRP